MPAEAAPVRRLARRSLRVHALLIGVVVLATLQAGLLLSAGSQLLNEERSKIEYHFRRLDGTLREQDASFASGVCMMSARVGSRWPMPAWSCNAAPCSPTLR